MRRSFVGNRPLVPNSNLQFTNSPSSLIDLSSINLGTNSNDGNSSSQQVKPVTSRRKSNAFSTPKPLITNAPLVRQISAEDDDSFISNYAAFLASPTDSPSPIVEPEDEKNREQVDAEDSLFLNRVKPSISSQLSTTLKGSNSVMSARRSAVPKSKFKPSPLLDPSFSTANNVDELAQKHREQQKISYMNSKKSHRQPLLSPKLQLTEEIDDGVKIETLVKKKPVVQTKTFQPLSSKKNVPKDSSDELSGFPFGDGLEAQDGNNININEKFSSIDWITNGGEKEIQKENVSNSEVAGTVKRKSSSELQTNIKFDFDGVKLEGTDLNLTEKAQTTKEPEPEVKIKNRGKRLMEMIRLDRVKVEVFRLEEANYEEFMNVVQFNKCKQVSTQTFDNGIEEGTQTDDPPPGRTKWTQKPAGWYNEDNAMSLKIKSAQAVALGVGDDTIKIKNPISDEEIEAYSTLDQNNRNDSVEDHTSLNKFLANSCPLMLAFLSTQKTLALPAGKAGSSSKNLVKFGKSFEFLKDLKIHSLYCGDDLIACCNGPMTFQDDNQNHVPYTIITIWTLKEPGVPLYFLQTFSAVSTIEINIGLFQILVGCTDASINIFNMKEKTDYHQEIEKQIIRPPSITTSCMEESPNHEHQITGLAILPETIEYAQVISLDKNQLLICWTLYLNLTKQELFAPEEKGSQSIWSGMKLKIRRKINLAEILNKQSISFLNMKVWQSTSTSRRKETNFLIGTNYGFIVKGNLNTENLKKLIVMRYHGHSYDEKDYNRINNISVFDCNLDYGVFIASCMLDHCQMFTFGRSKSILSLQNKGFPFKIRWSKIRGCMVYLGFSDRIEIWDLLSSDVTVENVIKFKDNSLQDFEIHRTNVGEFVITLTEDGLCLGSSPIKVLPMSSKDDSKFQMYIRIVS